MDLLKILLMIYVSVLLVSAIISALSYYYYRNKLYLFSLYLWLGSFVNFLVQGIFQKNSLSMVLGFSTYFVCSLVLVKILSLVTDIRFPIKKYVIVMVLGLLSMVAVDLNDGRFFWVALPVALAVAFPMVHSVIRALRLFGNQSKGVQIYCALMLVNSFHFLDYPFLRDDPTYAVFGFSFALILLMAFSIFLPSFIIKQISDQYAGELEEKVQNRTVELQDANRKLQAITAENKYLLSVVCHDIATPAQIVVSHAELMIKQNPEVITPESKMKKSLSKIVSSGQAIGEILKYVKHLHAYREGKVVIKPVPVDLVAVIAQSCQLFESKLKNKEIKMNFVNQLEGDSEVLADAVTLKNQVVNNLISNAIKFSYPKSEITITASTEGEWVNLVVTDSGVGVPKEIIEHLFNPQIATTQKGTQGEEGTGFGLPIVKTCLGQYGATIRVESRCERDYPTDHGTSFHIQFKKVPTVTAQTA